MLADAFILEYIFNIMERSQDSRPRIISNASCRIEISDEEGLKEVLDSSPGYRTLFSETYDQSLGPIDSIHIESSRYNPDEPSHIYSEIQHTGLEAKERQAFMRQCLDTASYLEHEVKADNYGMLFIEMPDATVTIRFNDTGSIEVETTMENGHDDYDHLARLAAISTGTVIAVDALSSISMKSADTDIILASIRNQYTIRLGLNDDIDSYISIDTPESEVLWQYEYAGAIEFDTRRGLDAVGGLEHVKEQLRENIAVIKHPDIAKTYDVGAPSHILLHGPPGTGKTQLARSFAEELGAELIEIRVSDIVDKFVGNSSKALREAFTKAKNKDNLQVVFFDEFESIGGIPQEDNSERGSVIKELLQQLNDISESHPNIIVVAASNAEMGNLSPALIRSGRLEPLAIPPPNEQERREIWAAVMMKALPDSPEDYEAFTPYADDVDIIELARISDGLTGADFVTILKSARKKRFMHAVASNHYTQVSHTDLVSEIRDLHRR